MTARHIIAIAACLMFLGVAAGAFGAHALRARLSAEQMAVFQTGVHYHLVHALGLFGVGLLAAHWRDTARGLGGVAALLVIGVVLFSGSLYALVLTGERAFGVITPFGGGAMLAAWALLAWIAARRAMD